MALMGRRFLIGILAGVVGATVWGVFLLWLDNTEQGQHLCYTRAIEVDRQRFEKAAEKVSMEEGVRIGRPSFAILVLKLILAFVWVALFYLAGVPEGRKAVPSVRSGGGVPGRQWGLSLLVSLLASFAVLIAAALLLL